MDITILLEKLCAIERSVEDGVDPHSIQALVIEVEECVIQLQRDVNNVQAEADLLRTYIKNAQRSSLFRLSCPCISQPEASQMRSLTEEPSAARSRGDDPLRPRFVN
jgi:hypothetical protein